MLFSKIGLAHKLDSGKYTACKFGKTNNKNHMHVILSCTVCMNTQELSKKSSETLKLSKKMTDSIKGLSQISSLTLNGVCAPCKKSSTH